MLELLEQKRIHVDANIPPHRFLFRWDGTPCFSRGELVAVTGKAKSGKTYLCSILMAMALQEELLCLRRIDDRPLRVLWIDTEQSEDSTQEILRDRIGRLVRDGRTGSDECADSVPDWEEHFAVYNLRSVSWRERMELVTAAIVRSGADLVVFDGIRDVVGDINDYTEAQQTVEKMLSLASWSGACIVCVLHQNKSVEDKTLRGALGTELQNKSFETYECSKNPDTRIFCVSQMATRKYDIIGKMEFSVDATGLPQFCGTNETSNDTMTRVNKVYNPYHFNEKYLLANGRGRLDIPALMRYVFGRGQPMRLNQIIEIVRKEAYIQSYDLAEKVIRTAYTENIIEPVPVLGNDIFRLHTPDLFSHQQGSQ